VTGDIDNMPSGTPNGTSNYKYDAEGRLIRDLQENIKRIVWGVDGKVKEILRNTYSPSQKRITFDYDAMGHRIAKHIYQNEFVNSWETSTYYVLDAQGSTMAVFTQGTDKAGIVYNLNERYIYGSSRVGVLNTNVNLYGSAFSNYSSVNVQHYNGRRAYELTNHLGNVLSTISDKPIPDISTGTTIDYYMADIRTSTDYSPFGVELKGRNLKKNNAKNYRFGFQGQEGDDQIKGDGNSVNFGARMYDSRLGKFLSLDAFFKKSSNCSPYTFSGNNPIACIDVNGDSVLFYSESGVYLGYSNDNHAYKGYNFVAIIKDSDVENFRNTYDSQRKATVPKGVNKTVYIEAIVAGLAKMAMAVYDVNSFVDFFNDTKGKKLVDGKLVEDKEAGDEYRKEFTADLVYKTLKFSTDGINYDLKVITVGQQIESGGKGGVITIPSNDGLGKLHTHPNASQTQRPTLPDDYLNGSKTSFNVVVSGTQFNLFKFDENKNKTLIQNVRKSAMQDKTFGKSVEFTDKKNQ
jgi:RHS repeat-associated protein